jgi:cytochrome b561
VSSFGWFDRLAPVPASEHAHENRAESLEFFAETLFVFASGYVLAALNHDCWRMDNTLRRRRFS